MGGNAVMGYYQTFDMEGDSGIVARTYGTCVLVTQDDPFRMLGEFNSNDFLENTFSGNVREVKNGDFQSTCQLVL